MIDRKDKRYVSCPVCGRHLIKCQGQCNIDITCGKGNREIVVIVDEERVMVLENRRTVGKNGESRTGKNQCPEEKESVENRSAEKRRKLLRKLNNWR